MTDHSHVRSHVTRKDRAIYEDAWIKEFLAKAKMGTLATVQDEQPYLSSLLFAYNENKHAIYLHTSRHGRVWENVHTNPRACFTATEMGRLLPAKTALNFSVEYQSVVVFGSITLVDNPAEAEFGLQLLLDKYFSHLHPGKDYRPITSGELEATAVFRFDVEEWSGKRKAVADEFPGAFFWGEKTA